MAIGAATPITSPVHRQRRILLLQTGTCAAATMIQRGMPRGVNAALLFYKRYLSQGERRAGFPHAH
jgi:hypothetical protein